VSHEPTGPLRGVNPVATILIFVALLVALGVGIAPNFNARVVGLGEAMWPGYAAELRTDPIEPECDVDALAERLKACPDPASTGPAPSGTPTNDDPFAGEDPFADPATRGPAPSGTPTNDDPFAGADPFADPATREPAPSGTPANDDPFGGADPFADPASTGPASSGTPTDPAPADDPFAGNDPFAPKAAPKSTENCPALRNLHATCVERQASYADIHQRITGSVRTFRSVEQAVSTLAKFPYQKHLLVLLVLLGSLTTTAQRMHIALRDPTNALEHRWAQGLQLLAHGFLVASCVADFQVQQQSAAEPENPILPLLWAGGFLLLSAINVVHLVRLPKDLTDSPTSLPRMLMVIPLYVYMAILAGLYFTMVEGHASGQAIFLHKFIQHPVIYVGIGLYIWAGMMLARTRVAPLAFDVLMPLQLPPVILAWLVIVLAAVPTAYSGASGIFVIAAGAVIFERLRAAGATPRIALAATAMSGSLGVVLRPCLVVVLVSVLNINVESKDLFDRGLQVFALTAVLSLLALLWRNDQPLKAPPSDAVGGIARAIRPLLPYVGLGVVVLGFYWVAFDTIVNEQTAPMVLPAVMLALVVYDRSFAPNPPASATGGDGSPTFSDEPAEALWPSLKSATGESAHHIGALLMVMVGSVGVGGVVERAEVMALVPESFGSIWLTMVVLVVIMVLVGMTMDALGAVVLVSVTVAQIAYKNGIDPVHFWMMVLCAFELGYLTPPVALNHLLARQVIGEPSHVEVVDPQEGFFAQYEHVILPMAIMGTALVLVAFVPLFFY